MIEKYEPIISSEDAIEGIVIDPPMSLEEIGRLQRLGRKPRMPIINEDGEIIS